MTTTDRDSIFHASPVPIIIVDATGKIIEANNVTTSISGYSTVELLGSNARTLFHPADVQYFEHTMAALRSNGNVSGVTMAIRLTTKSGSFIWVRLSFAMSHGDIVILFINPEDVIRSSVNPPQNPVMNPHTHSKLRTFIMENWKWLLGVLGVLGSGIIKLILVLNEMMEKLQITWG